MMDDLSNDIIQSHFDAYQAVLMTSRQSGDDAGDMRRELTTFLIDSANRLDSEGNKLVTMPNNFDTVVDAMGRDDVMSTEDRPWSKYLLTTSDLGFDRDSSDRYSTIIEDTKETKVQIGLAEIHLLDKQLGLLSRKEAILSHQDQSESATDDGTETPMTSRVTSRVTTPRSVMSKRDATFLTRTNKTSTVGARSEKSSPSSPSSPPKRGSSSTSLLSHRDDDDVGGQYDDDDVKDGQDSSQKKRKGKNFLKMNVDRVGSRSLLSKEDEERVRLLLEADHDDGDGGVNHSNAEEYGYTRDLLEYEKQLDSELACYGRLDRLTNSSSSSSSPGSSSSSRGNKQQDYLSEQRALRAQQEHIMKIDNMLEAVTSTLMDLSEMIRPSSSSSSVVVVRSDIDNGCSLDVPSIDHVRVGKRISVDDVMRMVTMAIHDVGLDVDINASENRREIDRLLGSLKSEIDRLAGLRSKSQYYRGVSSPFYRAVDESSHQGSIGLLNNQDLEDDHNHDGRSNNDYNNDYSYHDDDDDDDDDEEIIIEEPSHSTTTATFLPQVPGVKSRTGSRPGSSSSSSVGHTQGRDDDVASHLPEIMLNLTQQIANVKAVAATKNKLFINRLLRKEIKEEIRKVLH